MKVFKFKILILFLAVFGIVAAWLIFPSYWMSIAGAGFFILATAFFLSKPRPIKNVIKTIIKRVPAEASDTKPLTNGGKNIIGEFLRIQDVVGFFKYDINPGFIESKIEKATAAQLRGAKQIPVATIVTIIMVGVIALVIFQSVFGTDAQLSACIAKLGSSQSSSAQIVTQPTQPSQQGAGTGGTEAVIVK